MCDNLLKPPAERAAGGRTWQDVRNPSQKGCCVSDSEVTYIYILSTYWEGLCFSRSLAKEQESMVYQTSMQLSQRCREIRVSSA